MSGSKKGEHRGNARKRAAARPGAQTEYSRRRRRTHETPDEIMYGAARLHRPEPVVIERRITVARIINGPSDNIEDLTPREVLLLGMHHHMGAVRDLKLMLEHISEQPVSEDTTAKCNALDAEIERALDKAGEFAFKAAPFIHAKYTAISAPAVIGQNPVSVLELLVNEIDEIERSRPIPIEHKPQTTKTGGST